MADNFAGLDANADPITLRSKEVGGVHAPTHTVANAAGAMVNPATQETLAALLAAVQAQRSETLWTDDTGAYFVRLDAGGTLTWTDLSGNVVSAPGTGARPAEGTSLVVDRAAYQATAGGTGFSNGDYLDHFMVVDPTSGAPVGHWWLNTTTELKLASNPSSGSITPLSPISPLAATVAAQNTGNTKLDTLHADLGLLATQVTVAAILAKLTADPATQTGLANILTALQGVDSRSGAATITAADVATTTTAGQSGVNQIAGAPTANSSITWNLTGQSSLNITLTGPFVAGAVFDVTADGGLTYAPSSAKVTGTGAVVGSVTGVGTFRLDVAGMTGARLRATSYTSGTITAHATSSDAPGLTQVLNPVRALGIDGLTGATQANPAPVQNQGSVQYAGTTTPLAIAGTYTGTTRNVGVAPGSPNPYSCFNAFFLADVAGTAYIKGSNDGTTWYVAASSPVAANTPMTLTHLITFRYYRAEYLNGATIQGSFVSNDSFTAA